MTIPKLPKEEAMAIVAGMGDLAALTDKALGDELAAHERIEAASAKVAGDDTSGGAWRLHQANRVMTHALRLELRRREATS